MSALYGFVNTASWSADARPKSWREGYLKWYPNGDAIITAMSTQVPKKGSIDDPEHKWAVKDYPLRTGALEGIYTDPAFTTAYVNGGVTGDSLFLKITAANAAVAKDMRPRAKVRVSTTNYPRLSAVMQVTNVEQVASDYRISVRLMENDDNGSVYTPQVYIAECDVVTVFCDLNCIVLPNMLSAIPLTKKAISSLLNTFPSRLFRMIS